MNNAQKIPAKVAKMPEPLDSLEQQVFEYLCHKYVQRSDERQARMSLQYTTAETHDLAVEIAKFIREEVSG